MLKVNPSQEAAPGSPEAPPSTTRSETNTGVEVNTQLEGDNMTRRSSSRKYDRHDAGRYDGMSDDASGFSSSGESLASARRSRRMRQTTEANDYDGGVSDCSHCRKHRMAKARRSRRRKTRSRSRRRRR